MESTPSLARKNPAAAQKKPASIQPAFTSALLTLLFVLPLNLFAQDGWRDLFNGENLDGWIQRNGEAIYFVEDGAIVGEAVMNTPNSFLTTDRDYGNFILEYDVLLDTRVNSGVQIRSESKQDYMNGRVHGYQVELDPSPRRWSGGIYDEARRGWIYPLTRNKRGQAAFRNGQWNHFRVEAIGNEINVWVNGIQTTRLVDDLTLEGFIGLQVHSIRSEEQEGTQIRWRNIRIMTDNLDQHRSVPDPDVPEFNYLKNELTDHERRQGWRLLWDGESGDGWRSVRSEQFPSNGWLIEEGELVIPGSDELEERPGDLVTVDQFSNFELILDFKFEEGANSGIKYLVDPERLHEEGRVLGPEFQILDDRNHPDADQGVAGNRRLGSLYDLIPVWNLSEQSSNIRAHGAGQWNRARIVSKDGIVEHWLNNIKVVEYDRNSQMFKALVANSKFADQEDYASWPQGHILLQDHRDRVSFRSIKIREF